MDQNGKDKMIMETKEKINDYIFNETLTIERQIKKQEPVYTAVLARTFLERWGKEIKKFFWNYMTQQSNSMPQTQPSSASSYSGESNEGKTKGQFLKNFKTEITENKNEKMKRGLKKFKKELRNADESDVAEELENILDSKQFYLVLAISFFLVSINC